MTNKGLMKTGLNLLPESGHTSQVTPSFPIITYLHLPIKILIFTTLGYSLNTSTPVQTLLGEGPAGNGR